MAEIPANIAAAKIANATTLTFWVFFLVKQVVMWPLAHSHSQSFNPLSNLLPTENI
jgi:hypothetical protein